MKIKINLFIYIILISISIKAQQITQQITFTQNDLTITQKGNYDVIQLKNTTFLANENDAGNPQLPVKTIKLLLPKGARATNVTMNINSETNLGTFNVYPNQLPIYPNFEEPPAFVPQKQTIYTANTAFPYQHIIEYQTNAYRDYNFVTISFIPFRYLPLNQQLDFYTNVTINLNYTVNTTTVVQKLRPYDENDKMAYDYIKRSVLNKTQTDAFYPETLNKLNEYRTPNSTTIQGKQFQPTDLPALAGSTVKYVIITNNTTISGEPLTQDGETDFTTVFQQFADYKTTSGTPAKVVTVNEIRNNYAGVDVAEQIREFIKEAHQLWGTEYVLLAGNANIVPVRHFHIKHNPTDLYYSAILHHTIGYNDNWNKNGDTIFGFGTSENGDYCDFTPDIAVGRAPVDTIEEVNLFLEKNFAYNRSALAQNIPAETNWLNKQLNIGGLISDGPWPTNSSSGLGLPTMWYIETEFSEYSDQFTMLEYYEHWNNPFDPPNTIGYENLTETWQPAYNTNGDGIDGNNGDIMDAKIYNGADGFNHDTVIGKINEKPGIIFHLDHSGPSGMGLTAVLGLTSAIRATDFHDLTDDKKYPVLINGGCDTVPIDRDYYIGEQWLNTPTGGVACLGTSWDVPVNTTFQFTENLFEALYVHNNFKIGNLKIEAADGDTGTNTIYNLLGDPDLSIFTDAPTPMSVTYQTNIDNGNQDFEVNVTNFPIGKQVKVSLYKANEVLAYIETDTFPINFNITPDTYGNDLKITATCHNKEPFEAVINVSQTDKSHLYKSNITVLDANADGNIEPGETVNLSIDLSNTGLTNTTNISAILTTSSDSTTISQDTATFNNIDADQTNSSNINYTFIASQSNEYGNAIPFTLTINALEDGNAVVFTEEFLLNIKSHKLDIGNRSVLVNTIETNTLNANDNVSLFVDIHNYSQITAKSLTAVLTTNLPANIAIITTNTQTYGDITSFDLFRNENPFTITIGANYTDEELLFELTLTDTFGKTNTFNIILNEEDILLIDDFSFLAGKEDITLTWQNAVWIEPTQGTNDGPDPPCGDPPLLACTGWLSFTENIKGNNIYRSETINGTYQKINNFLITGTSMYFDTNVNELTNYYYKISVVSPTGDELPLNEIVPINIPEDIAYQAWTSLQRHTGFPIKAFTSAATNGLPSPTVYDINGDGTKEIFTNYRNSNDDSHLGRMMGFYHTGQELFEIDPNETEIWGFAETEERLDVKKSAIADINNDGKPEIFSSGYKSKLYGFTFEDADGNNKPDEFWTDGPLNRDDNGNDDDQSWSTPILADLNNNGFKEIIVITTYAKIMVFDHNKNLLGTKTIPNYGWNLSDIAVADMDNDGFKEIVIGYHPKDKENDIPINIYSGAIFVWNHDGDFQNTELTNINDQLFEINERTDGGITLADIDNDNELEILTVSKLNATTGKIYALNLDGTPVNDNWNGSQTITIDNGNTFIPRISVGDLNNDGKLEVVFGSKNKLYVLDNLGNIIFEKNINSTKGNAPILADIDDDDDIEIIINSDGIIFAYNFDGTECVGWRLQTDTGSYFVGSPYIGDIDNDGFNDVVISSDDTTTYVWNTTGDTDKVEWESYRANPQNTGVYGEKCIFKSNKTIELTDAHTTWSTSKHIQGDLVIKANASLTINSRVTFASNSKLIVETGAKLIIDNNAVLTNKCNGLWQGITVQGNRLLPQTEANQGVLEINNGAIIEHAKIGVLAANFSFARDDNRATGAIIRIDNAIFRDNIIGVEIPAYTLNNISYIKNSLFETTEYLANINKTPNRFISLYDVATIEITDNTFINHAEIDTYTDLRELKNQGKGIVSFNAAMNVNGNNFENLYKAIETQGTNTRNCKTRDCLATDIDNNNFINNWNAIYLNNNNSVKVTSNDIQVFTTQLAEQENGSSGMYILSSNGFQIENNTLYSSPIGGFTNGIYIQDCSAVNKIYKNYFNNLHTAIYAKGKNTVNSPLYDETTEGLQIICNEFQDNSNDIYIAPNSYMTPLIGSNEISAGNTFNPICSDGIKEFNNQGYNQVNYIAEFQPEQQPNCNNNVNLFHTFGHHTCPLTLSSVGISAGLITSLKTNIDNNKALIVAITDGGDTESLNETVEDTENNQAIKLRNELLFKSPYLSDTVMVKTTSVEDVLPSFMVKQVLSANPKAAKSSKVQNALDSRENQLPTYMRDEIDLGKNILSYKEDIESKLSDAIHQKEFLINRLIAKYKRDTTATTTQLKDLLITESQERLKRNYELADYYLTQGETQNAENTFNNITQNFDLSNAEQTEYNNLSQLFNLKKDIISNNKTWYQLSESQLETVTTFATDSTSVTGLQSRAILSLIDDIDYGLPIPALETNGRQSTNQTVNYNIFEVMPSIATNYFIINYTLDYEETIREVTFDIYNNKGKKMLTKTLKTRENQFLTECNNWEEGIYWCKKITNGRIIQEKRFIIKRDKTPIIENLLETFSVYPNPTDNQFFVDFNIFNIKDTSIQITDVKGSVVQSLMVTENTNKVNVDTKSWQSGIYFVSLLSNNKLVKTVKVVIK